MKKKLFLFITCFFLLSSLTIFLTYRNIQLSEIIKKEKEEVKRLIKELKEQKEKNSANQDEDYLDDLPWLLNWKGATISLEVCGFIAVPGGMIIKKNFPKIIPKNNLGDKSEILIIDAILLTILFFGLPPFLLAIAKYKDRSYKERYCLLWRDYWKPVACFALSQLFFIILLILCDALLKKNTDNNSDNSDGNLPIDLANSFDSLGNYDYNNDNK